MTEQVTSQWAIGSPFSVRSAMQGITFQVILKAVFGLEEGTRYEQLQQLLTTRLDGTKSIFRAILLLFPFLQKDWGPLSPWGRLMENERQIDKLIYAEIQERREKPDPWQLELTNSKPMLPVRRGLLLAPPDDFQMVTKGMRHQNQQILQTSSISG